MTIRRKCSPLLPWRVADLLFFVRRYFYFPGFSPYLQRARGGKELLLLLLLIRLPWLSFIGLSSTIFLKQTVPRLPSYPCSSFVHVVNPAAAVVRSAKKPRFTPWIDVLPVRLSVFFTDLREGLVFSSFSAVSSGAN